MNGFTWRTVLIKATLIRKIHELNKDNANEKKRRLEGFETNKKNS